MFNPVFLYRISNYFFLKKMVMISKLIDLFVRFFYTCYIPGATKIGKNFVLGYGGMSIVIHPRVIIGDDCHIDQCVTIGGTSKKFQVPTIGDSVYVGAGAKIIGDIIIGNNVVVGANSVVVSDIPNNSLVVGIPARIIKNNIKKEDYV